MYLFPATDTCLKKCCINSLIYGITVNKENTEKWPEHGVYHTVVQPSVSDDYRTCQRRVNS